MRHIALGLLLSLCAFTTQAEPMLPSDEIISKLPEGYVPEIDKVVDFNGDNIEDRIVIAIKVGEDDERPAPERFVIVFKGIKDGNHFYEEIARNSSVAYRADEGGQCNQQDLAVKGKFFTVENTVTCGQHWTDFITFRYNAAEDTFMFHKRIHEIWVDPTATKPSSRTEVTANKLKKAVTFADYQRD